MMKEVKKIRKAVIPAAGLGTRYLPATKIIPKEMIPIVDIPMIQYNIEEAVKAGIEEIILITARNKSAIEDHFDYHYELEDTLNKRGKSELAALSRSIADMCKVYSVRQKEPLGLGHAVLAAASIVGDEPFAVLLGDDLVDSEVPCIGQLIKVFQEEKKSVVGVMRVEESETCKYGIIDPSEYKKNIYTVNRLVEKPLQGKAPSCLAIPGRYVLDSKIFTYLKEVKPGASGEIQLTDALEMLAKNEGLLAHEFVGTRHDAGDHLGFIEATIAYALKRENLKSGVQAILRKYMEK